MPKVLKRTLLGFAWCPRNRSPWWKFWIRVYWDELETGHGNYYCGDCRNACENWMIWFPAFWNGTDWTMDK